MGMGGKILRALGHISTLEWAYRLLATVVGVGAAIWALIEGWSLLAVILAGLVTAAAGLALISVAHYWFNQYRQQQFPEHHKALLLQLAAVLAEMKASALTVGSWERMNPAPHQVAHSERHRDIVTRAAQLVDQISYDESTTATCKDFAQLCHFIVYDAIHKVDYSQSRRELDEMSIGLFRQLHAGKSVDRNKIELPDWIRQLDGKAKLDGTERDRSSVRRLA